MSDAALPHTIQDILMYMDRHQMNKIKVAVADIDGVLRGKYIHKDKLKSALESGMGFCSVVFGWDSGDVCYSEGKFAGWHNGYPDSEVQLDPMSFRLIPWENNQPFLLGHFGTAEGKPMPLCPRQLVRKIQAKATSLGFQALAGMEFEWFNFKETSQTLQDKGFHQPEPITPGMFGYSLLRSGQNRDFMTAIMDELLAFNVPVEGLHTETGPGVYEAALTYTEMLEAADRATLFKSSVKEIGHRFGIMPSFMARWNTSLPGCSGHIHQSLKRLDTGENAFYGEGQEHSMSETFKSYVAGQLLCLPELLPMFAPTVNSYKRLVEGFWAPTRVTWGIDNRTTALRVIPGSPKSTRLETRVAGADVNPYLVVAASIAAGLYGIEKGLTLNDAPVLSNGYESKEAKRLPASLTDAAQAMHDSKIARELFGNEFVDHFTYTRQWEWQESQKAVTDWELKRYFEII